MVARRAASALIGAPIVLVFIFAGSVATYVLVVILALLGLREYLSLLLRTRREPAAGLVLASAVILPSGALLAKDVGLLAGLTSLLLIMLGWLALRRGKIDDAGLTILGPVYVSFLFSFILLLRLLSLEAALLVILGTWAFDILAFFVGRSLGKHRLLPEVSPGKTWEGVLGGLVGASAVIVVLFFSVGLPGLDVGVLMRVLLALATGIIVAIGATVGDLVESYLKRQLGVKDSGALIPGHGGLLDRFDSLLFTTALGYYWLRLFV